MRLDPSVGWWRAGGHLFSFSVLLPYDLCRLPAARSLPATLFSNVTLLPSH
jgi:hypothetical protein